MADDRIGAKLKRMSQMRDILRNDHGLIMLHAFGTRRIAVAALIGRNATEPVIQMRDLMPPSAVIFREAVQKHERGRIARSAVPNVQFNAIGKLDAGQIAHAHTPWLGMPSRLDRKLKRCAAGHPAAFKTIGRCCRNDDFSSVTHAHVRNGDLPAFDQAGERESRRFAARNGTIEFFAVYEMCRRNGL